MDHVSTVRSSHFGHPHFPPTMRSPPRHSIRLDQMETASRLRQHTDDVRCRRRSTLVTRIIILEANARSQYYAMETNLTYRTGRHASRVEPFDCRHEDLGEKSGFPRFGVSRLPLTLRVRWTLKDPVLCRGYLHSMKEFNVNANIHQFTYYTPSMLGRARGPASTFQIFHFCVREIPCLTVSPAGIAFCRT